MATLEIDPEEFIKILTNAVMVAVQASKPQPEPEPKAEPPKPKKKRGRPKGSKAPKAEEVVVVVGDTTETLKEILEYKEPNRNDYLAPSKRANFVPRHNESTAGLAAHAQSVVDPNRKIKFFDDPIVGDRHKYADPIPTTRAPAVKQKFTCDRCHRQFEAYWTEVPQALHRERINGIGEGQPMITCDNCMGR